MLERSFNYLILLPYNFLSPYEVFRKYIRTLAFSGKPMLSPIAKGNAN